MYEIKALSGSSEQIIYSPDTQDERPVTTAKGSFEVSEGGSIDLSLAYGHPLYDQLEPLATYISVTDDGEEIFYGRISGKSDPTFTGVVSYTAEGAISFLHDSQVPPEPRDSKGKQSTRKLSAEAFFRWCIDQHNSQVNDPRRQFTVGQITATKKNDERDYQITSYTETKNAIDQYITGVYGGFIRVRKENNTHYIDWIQDFGRTNPQAITLGENVVSHDTAITAEGFYTVLLPVGDNGLTLDTPTIDLLPAEKMASYGRIIKVVTFSNVSSKETLQQMANNYVSRLNMDIPYETSIHLIDMHYLDGSIPKIRLGDVFNNIHGAEGKEFTVGHMDIDFMHIENDTFSFKNVKDLEGDLTSLKGGISKSAGRSSGGVGLGLKYYHEETDKAKIIAHDIELLGSDVSIQGDNITALSERVEDTEDNINIICGTAVIQNSAEIANVAGKFQVRENYYDDWPMWMPDTIYHLGDKVKVTSTEGGWYGYYLTKNDVDIDPATGQRREKDYHHSSNKSGVTPGNWLSDPDEKGYWTEHHGRQSVLLLDGAALEIDDDNGIRQTVGNRISYLDSKSLEIEHDIDVMVGSALWTQRDHITGVCGEYEIHTDPNTGEKSLVICNGGGFRIQVHDTEYGLYHEGNLEGGILVRAINHGHANTRTVWFNNDHTVAYSDARKAAGAPGNVITPIEGVMYIDKDRDSEEYQWRYEWDGTQYVRMTTYETHILGDSVIVGNIDDATAQTMKDKFGELDGIVAAKATIGQLNALSARVGNIEADYITTQNLVAEVARATKITTRALDVGGNLRVVGDQGNPYTVTFGNYVTTNISSPNTYDYEGTSVDMRKAFYDVEKEVNGNEVTLVFKTMYGLSTQEKRVTFNRAASVNLTGSWSSRTFTVTETNSGETYSETPVYSTGTGYSQYDSITVNSFSSAHYAYARVSSSSNQGSNVLFGFKIDANGQYNSGWDYGQTQITRATRAATSQETTIKTLDYSERFAIVDTYAKSDGTMSEIKYIVEAKADRYSDGQAAVTLTGPSWSNTSTPNSTNTVSVSTSGRPTQLSKSTTLHLTVGSWSSGSIPVYIRETSTSGTIRAQNSVSMPAVSSTTWTNTTGRTWRADISIGGVTRSSSTKDFDGYYTDGQAAVTLTDPSWNSVSTLTSSRTVTVSTSGRPTQLSKSKTVFLTTGSWGSGSIPIYIRDGSTSGTIVAQSSVSLPGVSGFDTTAPANESYTNSSGTTYTNNSSGYQILSTGSSGTAAIVVKSTWSQGGSTVTGKSYLTSAPTFLYRAAYSSGDTAGYNRSAAESPTGFSSYSPANESYAIPGGNTITNNSDGYYLQSSGSSGVAYIVVTGSWTQSGQSKTSKNYLRGAPTALYRKGYSDGYSGSASESPTGFDCSAPASESYAIPGGNVITNNSDGYYVASTGSSGMAYIVVKGTWTQSGQSKTGKNYLGGAPTALYRKGYSDGAASSASPEWIGQGYVANTNNLPDGTKHSLSGLKTVIVDNRSKQGYIYFRIKISGTYHVFYFVDNGNGWTS